MKTRFILTLFTLLLLSKNAFAYLDPGTGSLIIQSIIAAVAGALYTGKLYWFKIKKFFSKKK